MFHKFKLVHNIHNIDLSIWERSANNLFWSYTEQQSKVRLWVSMTSLLEHIGFGKSLVFLKLNSVDFLLKWTQGQSKTFWLPTYFIASIDCCTKFATGLHIIISHSSKSIWVIKLFFCQNDSPMGVTFWQKDSLITHIHFKLCLIMIFSQVANFAQQSLQEFLRNLKKNSFCPKQLTFVSRQKTIKIIQFNLEKADGCKIF